MITETSSLTLNVATDVGRLLGFATDVSAVPGVAGDAAIYRELVDRYLADATFRSLVDDILEGLGCVVANANIIVGLVVRASPSSPWAWPQRTTDLPWNRTWGDASERALRAVVIPALIAYVAPSAADLDDLLTDPTVVAPAVTPRELEAFVRGFCEQHEVATDDTDLDQDNRPFWWYWLQLPAVAPTGNRIGRKTTTYVVHEVLTFLNELGLVAKSPGLGGAGNAQFRPRRQLLDRWADLQGDELFTLLVRHADNLKREG